MEGLDGGRTARIIHLHRGQGPKSTASNCSFGRLSCSSSHHLHFKPQLGLEQHQTREQKRLPKQLVVFDPDHFLQKGRAGAAVLLQSQSGCVGSLAPRSIPANLLTQIVFKLPPGLLISVKVTFSRNNIARLKLSTKTVIS